jgi:hypothetical protein
VRKFRNEIGYFGAGYDILNRYADLLERIEKAPVAKVRGKVGEIATIAVSHDLAGKRVALVEVE